MGKKLFFMLLWLMLLILLPCLQNGLIVVKAPDGEVRTRPQGFDFGTVYTNCRIDASCTILGGTLNAVTSFPDWMGIDFVDTSQGWFRFHVNTASAGNYSGVITVATDVGDGDVPVNVTVRDEPRPKLSMLVYESPFDRYSTDYPEDMKFMTSLMDLGYVNVSYSFDFLPPEDYDLVLVAEDGLTFLTAGEVDLLKTYVDGGGSLVVCADAFYGGSITVANQIINDFGLNMRSEEYGFQVIVTEFAEHAITDGVGSICLQRPSPVEKISDTSVAVTILAHPSGAAADEGVLAISEHNGKLIVLGDSLWWYSYLRWEEYDNSKIFLNIFDYVANKAVLLWSDAMEVNDVAVSKDGKYLVAVNNTGVYYFASGDPNPRWWCLESDPAEDFMSVAISKDGEYVVAGQSSGYIYYFSDSKTAAGQRLLPTWKSEDLHGPVEGDTLDMSENGEYVAVGGTGVNLYYFAACTGRLGASESPTWFDGLGVLDIRTVRISSDGKYVAAGGTRSALLGFVAFYKDANAAPYPTEPAWQAESSLESIAEDLALSDDGYSVVAVTVNVFSLHYWANATALSGDPGAAWTNVGNYLSVDVSLDGSKVVGGGVDFTSVHFWAGARTRAGSQTEDWVRLESLHVLDVALSGNGGIIAASGMTGPDGYKVYFLKSDGTVIGNYALEQFSPVVAMSGDGFTIAVGGPGYDSLYVFGLTLPKPVHNVNTGLNYTSIQDAIDASETLDGHVISVDEGTYYEHVVVHKSLTLLGEEAGTTVIDGGRIGNVVELAANYVTISGFTVQNSGETSPSCGVYVAEANGTKVIYNIIRDNYYGVRLHGSSQSSIHTNIVSNNTRYGIALITSSGCSVYENLISKNTNGIYLSTSRGNTIRDNDVFLSTENGIWLYRSSNNTVYGNDASYNLDSGLRLSSDSNGNTVYSNTLSENSNGFTLYRSGNNTVFHNVAFSNVWGIHLWESGGNTLYGNNMTDNRANFGVLANNASDLDNSVDVSNMVDGKPIYYLKDTADTVIDASTNAGTVYLINCNNVTIKDLTVTKNGHGLYLWNTENSRIENVTAFDNVYGIVLTNSSSNIVFHNNFDRNTQNAYAQNSTNTWDNGLEGNYWSNYTGSDLNEDGIGDAAFEIDVENVDNFPLMGMFHSYYAEWGNVDVVSNSTVLDFKYDKSNSTIMLHVTNMTADQISGFCRITIPYDVLPLSYTVTINGSVVPYTTVQESYSASTIYFSYEHSTLEIVIVPEFAMIEIFLLCAILTFVVVASKKGTCMKHRT